MCLGRLTDNKTCEGGRSRKPGGRKRDHYFDEVTELKIITASFEVISVTRPAGLPDGLLRTEEGLLVAQPALLQELGQHLALGHAPPQLFLEDATKKVEAPATVTKTKRAGNPCDPAEQRVCQRPKVVGADKACSASS
eukprot:COSAG02_NODE_575_length_20117_cov_5.801139_5_plen_138_part_00